MTGMRSLVVAVLLACSAPVAHAAPCVGFTDVDATSVFCPNVEWIKNRSITLGCSSTTLYCPNDPVSRLSMAAFLNRLGTALTPVAVTFEDAPGALDLDLAPVVCQTGDYGVADFPRRVDLDANVSGTALAAVSVAATLVKSIDAGTTWTPVSAAEGRGLMGSGGGWGSVSQVASVELDVGQSVRFGLRLARVSAAAVDLSDSRCQVKRVISSRDGTTPPR
jgi:hypothetical protein